MTKPDDIREDVWDAACEAFNVAWDAHDDKFSPASNSISEGLCLRFIEASARAIMAERERASAWYLDAIAQRDRYAAEREQMAQDWCKFCEAIGVDVDTHEAVADQIKSMLSHDQA